MLKAVRNRPRSHQRSEGSEFSDFSSAPGFEILTPAPSVTLDLKNLITSYS